jgi:hypothetical protein
LSTHGDLVSAPTSATNFGNKSNKISGSNDNQSTTYVVTTKPIKSQPAMTIIHCVRVVLPDVYLIQAQKDVTVIVIPYTLRKIYLKTNVGT